MARADLNVVTSRQDVRYRIACASSILSPVVGAACLVTLDRRNFRSRATIKRPREMISD
jgi:hypothetical protein